MSTRIISSFIFFGERVWHVRGRANAWHHLIIMEEGEVKESVPIEDSPEGGDRINLLPLQQPGKKTEHYSWSCLWDEIK